MSVFFAKRLFTFIATLFGASLVVFLALEILPGDPAYAILGPDAEPSAYQALRQDLGLDRPAVERYVSWIAGVLVGDLGVSYTYSVPVSDLVLQRLALTVPLAVFAMGFTVVTAIGLGLFAAAHHKRAGDWGIMAFSQLGIALPNFWFGILLILFFSVYLGWFSSGGFPGWDAGVWPALKALLLPAVALATVQAAILARVTRSSVLETIREDYVRTARARVSPGAPPCGATYCATRSYPW